MTDPVLTTADLEQALARLRPELHRYLARMMGSVFEGEDVLQDAMLAATSAFPSSAPIQNVRAWLFRIAHNTALNAIRHRKVETAMKQSMIDLEGITTQMPTHGGTADALVPYMALTPKQRSAVIFRDVLGYAAQEVAELTSMSLEATKSALRRGRGALRASRDEPSRALTSEERARLQAYATHFNAHDFDRIRELLSEEVHLDLVSVEKRDGATRVGHYFSNYAKVDDWHMVPGTVEHLPAILVFNRQYPEAGPAYAIRLDFTGAKLARIQDFRYARYILESACWSIEET